MLFVSGVHGNASATARISKPYENQHLPLAPGQLTRGVSVSLSVDVDTSQIDIRTLVLCVDYSRVNENGEYASLASSCFPVDTRSITLDGSSAGTYQLDAYIQYNQVELSRIQRTFHITEISASVPSLSLVEENPIYILPPANVRANANLPFTVQSAVFDLSDFRACAVMYSLDGQLLLNKYCMELEDPTSSLTFYNLMLGAYSAHLNLCVKLGEACETITDTAVSSLIKLSAFETVLPVIQLANNGEFEVGADAGGTGDASIVFSLVGPSGATQHAHVCAVLLASPDSEYLPRHFHVTSSESSLSIPRVAVGDYTVRLTVCVPENNQYQEYSESSVTARLICKHTEEFRPSYEWQPLHAWNTVPVGSETR
jgi:hypothetical protein